jgi:hypothetical protein
MIMKKGITLPINTLVIVAIAVIILLALAAFFMGGFAPTSQKMQQRQEFLNACQVWTQFNCDENYGNINDIFKKYNVWTEKYKTGGTPCTQLGTPGCPTKDDVLSELKSACGCYGIGVPTLTTGEGGGEGTGETTETEGETPPPTPPRGEGEGGG